MNILKRAAKSNEKKYSVDISAIIETAKASPKKPPRFYDMSLDRSNIDPGRMVHYAAIWSHENARHMRYTGQSVSDLEAVIEQAKAKRKEQKREEVLLDVELNRQAGGEEAQRAYARAGIELPIDPKTLADRNAARKRVAETDAELARLNDLLTQARAYEKATSDLAQIIGALITGAEVA